MDILIVYSCCLSNLHRTLNFCIIELKIMGFSLGFSHSKAFRHFGCEMGHKLALVITKFVFSKDMSLYNKNSFILNTVQHSYVQ